MEVFYCVHQTANPLWVGDRGQGEGSTDSLRLGPNSPLLVLILKLSYHIFYPGDFWSLSCVKAFVRRGPRDRFRSLGSVRSQTQLSKLMTHI